jgi:pimeloyl-ACP methyl ester carboxylesterase
LALAPNVGEPRFDRRLGFAHGSLATGSEEWEAQQPLAEEGFRLLVVDRRGYGRSPAASGEDFLRDAEDVAGLMDDGAHLVGHSYGGLGVMVAAARRPEATRSLAELEPPAITLGQDDQAARDLTGRMREVWELDLPDGAWMENFLEAVGSNPKGRPRSGPRRARRTRRRLVSAVLEACATDPERARGGGETNYLHTPQDGWNGILRA